MEHKEGRYNKHLKCRIYLNEGERSCPKCQGAGTLVTRRRGRSRVISLVCNKCLGYGKLDWVEDATGRIAKKK